MSQSSDKLAPCLMGPLPAVYAGYLRIEMATRLRSIQMVGPRDQQVHLLLTRGFCCRVWRSVVLFTCVSYVGKYIYCILIVKVHINIDDVKMNPIGFV